MTKAEDRELLRRLAGGRPAGEDGGPRAAAEGDRLAALWAELEAPPAEPAPPGFADRVMARVREEARRSAPRGDTLTRRFGVVPARLAAASALAAGLVVGAGLGVLVVAPGGGEGLDGGGGPAAPFVAEPDLADGYLAALAELEEAS